MPAIDLTPVLGAPAAPVSAPAPVSPTGETSTSGESGIPEDVLALPEFSGLLEGKPPAVYVDKGFSSPETQVVMQHTEELANAGFGFYPAKDGSSVIFNTQFISPEEIQQADAAGKLQEVATPFSELKASFDAVTGGNPLPEAGTAPAAAPASSPALPAPAPAGVQKKLATARIKNATPGSPTSGPVPGQGRILNSILTQPV